MSTDKKDLSRVIGGVPAPSSLDEVQRLAKLMVASGYFQSVKDIAQGSVKIMAAQELGMGAVAGLMHTYFVNGRLAFEGIIIASAIKRKGYQYRPVKHDSTICVLKFFDPQGHEIGESSYSMTDATAAGLAGKDNWKKHPRNMLFWRALANGARFYCADVFGGVAPYMPEELGAEVDLEGRPVVDVSPTPITGSHELNEKLSAKRPAVKRNGNGSTTGTGHPEKFSPEPSQTPQLQLEEAGSDMFGDLPEEL